MYKGLSAIFKDEINKICYVHPFKPKGGGPDRAQKAAIIAKTKASIRSRRGRNHQPRRRGGSKGNPGGEANAPRPKEEAG
ncbi:hypothetical protein CR513_56256, partial [Mucuna pruriens]